MLYLDTSLVTALIVREARSDQARRWLVEQDPNQLLTSRWTVTEVASALSIKQRTGTLKEVDRVVADRLLDQLVDETLSVLDVQRGDFAAAARMCSRPAPPLRSGDALHLAVAARHAATIHTLDDDRAVAARTYGIDAVISVEKR
jgi:predicted nucleic acid-binding protein